jgi:hypothetical protein
MNSSIRSITLLTGAFVCAFQTVATASIPLVDDTLWDLLRTSNLVPAKAVVQPTKPSVVSGPAQTNGKTRVAAAGSTPPKVGGLAAKVGAGVPAADGIPGSPGTGVALTPDGKPVLPDGTAWDLLRTADPTRVAAAPDPTQNPQGDPNQADAGAAANIRKNRPPFYNFFNGIGLGVRKIGKQLDTDLKLTGMKTMGFHMENVSGSRDSYQNGQYFGRQGAFGAYDLTDLTIQGSVAKTINFQTRLTNQFYSNPNDNRFSINYKTKGFTADIGDIQAGFTGGNSLIDFSRALKGVQVGVEVTKGLKLTTLYSQTRAQTRTISLNGANRSGPYYVYAGQVVDGSVQVRINNLQLEAGKDYTLDPFTGELNFLEGRIVGELDVIAISFEAYSYNSQPGTLSGSRVDLTMLRNTKLGFSYLSQVNANGNNALNEFTQQFYGYSDPASPYVLDYPVEMTVIKDAQGTITNAFPTRPMTVTVDSIPQIYGTNYAINPALPNRVFFNRPLSPNQIVTIKYTPVRQESAPGNRSVMGMDGTVYLGKMGSITAEYAKSAIGFSSGNVNDAAMQLRSNMILSKELTWTWNYRNIGENFSAIESPGFRRNEKGFTTAFDYTPFKNVKVQASLDKSTRPSYDYSSLSSGSSTSLATSNGTDKFTQTSLGASWILGSGTQLSFNHNQMSTGLSTGGYTKYITDSATFGAGLGQLKLDLTLGRNVNQANSILQSGSGGASTSTSYGTSAINGRMGMGWRFDKRIGFTTAISASKMRSQDGNANTAKDIQFGIDTEPLPKMRLQMQYQLQDSGGYSLFGAGYNNTTAAALTRQAGGQYGSGFNFGSTSGYTGYSNYGGANYFGGGYNTGLGGFGNYSGGLGTGGLGGIGGLGGSSFAGKSKAMTVGWSYQPWNSLTLDAQMMNSASLGDYLYNSNQNSMTLGLGYQAGEKFQINLGMSKQVISYTGSNGGTNTNMFFLNVRGKPIGRLSTTLSYQMMKSNTSTASSTGSTGGTGGTNGTGVDLGGYLGGSGSSSFFGGGASNINSYQIGLEYPLFGGYNWYLNYDSSSTTGYFASMQTTFRSGINFDLTQNLKFLLGWRIQKYTTVDSTGSGANFSYRARSLDADLQFHF